MSFLSKVESGNPGFDAMVDSIRLGDNVVWQIDDMASYSAFALSFARRALSAGRPLAYIRFGAHPQIIPEGEPGVTRINLDASTGFEQFTGRIHQVITELGFRAFYVFDCLSDLVDAWATDLMIGNFFVATCPYLFELETVAYFGIMRNRHSSETIARIRETTQLFLELYGQGRQTYVQPLKVWKRYAPTMFLPHRQDGDSFLPLVSSSEAASFFSQIGPGAFRGQAGKLDSWDRLFQKAEELCESGAVRAEKEAMKDELCSRLTCRDEKVVDLARRWFALEDLVQVKRRMIGTGYVGGKAAGMLLARKIIEGSKTSIETHDSFYVGSDVFYTYLVQNGLWRLRMRQKTPSGYLALAPDLREGLSKGAFPEGIREQFYQMLEYFGQSPIIVRSSSLLEDGFGNAFAGKYDSVFCVNQGDPETRYRDFESAVRRVYASMMGDSALSYRLRMGLSEADEQMALLVQRVSGSFHGGYFFPFMAGVADSRNAYAWKPGLDPRAGMLRLVLGLGTRAVDRTGDDWPRLVALDDPLSHPYKSHEELIKHSQRAIDALDLAANAECALPMEDALKLMDSGLLDSVSQRDYQAEERLVAMGRPAREIRYAALEGFLRDSRVCQAMGPLLSKLEEAYASPVDAEFTINPSGGDSREEGDLPGFSLNILQCRPLAVRGLASGADSSDAKAGPGFGPLRGRIILDFHSGAMGGGFERSVKRLIYISPSAYIQLPPTERINLAQAVGKLNAMLADRDRDFVVFLSPGRCGSTMADLGLPVSFAEICNFGAIGEMSDPAAGFVPELSYGSHFFRDLVETQIYYMAIFAEKEGVVFNREIFLSRPNILTRLLPGTPFEPVLHVCDFSEGELILRADLGQDRSSLYLPG